MSALSSRGAVLLVLLQAVADCSVTRLACRDNKGNEVPWYTVYKMPQEYVNGAQKESFPPHLYMDARNPFWSWSKEGHKLDSSEQAVGLTLKQVYQAHGSKTIGYFFYNDEKPESLGGGGFTQEYAHAKGVFVVSAEGSGFWLVHSVPKYPPPSAASYSYPSSGRVYGQHFLCLTVKKEDFDRIGYQLRLNRVWLYDTNFPTTLHDLSPNLLKLSTGSLITGAGPTTDVSSLQTTPSENTFVSFSKSSAFGKDLYDSLVAPVLKADLLTETWNHGSKNNINSTCDTKYQVHDIVSVANNKLGISFENGKDHSKFAVSSAKHVCVGDINRQLTQMKRGGGTVCFFSPEAAQAYNSLIDQTKPCPKKKPTTHHSN